MTTDRELLELAAKAAGYVVRWYDDTLHCGPTFGIEVEPGNPCGFDPWNPLRDDGDALRLAVRLGILLRTDFIKTLSELMENGIAHTEATRRAIVMIAYKIGRRMP